MTPSTNRWASSSEGEKNGISACMPGAAVLPRRVMLHVTSLEKEFIAAICHNESELVRRLLAMGCGVNSLAGNAKLRRSALLFTLAVAIHNIPEGIAAALPLLYGTGDRRKAFGWATLSGLVWQSRWAPWWAC